MLMLNVCYHLTLHLCLFESSRQKERGLGVTSQEGKFTKSVIPSRLVMHSSIVAAGQFKIMDWYDAGKPKECKFSSFQVNSIKAAQQSRATCDFILNVKHFFLLVLKLKIPIMFRKNQSKRTSVLAVSKQQKAANTTSQRILECSHFYTY